MIQLRPWKVVLVVLAAVFGILFSLPNALPADVVKSLPGFLPKQRLNLGLDLQGGSYLLYEVDTDALRKEQLNNLVEDVAQTLRDKQIGAVRPVIVNGGVQVHIADPAQLPAAVTALNALARPLTGIAGRDITVAAGPGQTVVLTYNPQAARESAAKAVDQSIEVIRRRIDQLGTREPTIIRQGATRIVVEAPGESDPEKLKRVIGQTAKLTFQAVDDSVPVEEALAGHVPPDAVLLPSDESFEKFVLVKKRVVLSGELLTSASQGFDENGQPDIEFRFNGRGAQKFGDYTRQNIGKRFAIILDNKVISAPTIQTAILGGSGRITGNFTQESASEIAGLLRSGALPAPLKVQDQRTVGAELGADSVRSGAISLGIGAAAIVAFIVLAYGLFGVFAAIALIVNGLLIVGIMSLSQGTLTLPGIAGVILTLAVAVDANVLIYERMRDEERAGRSPLVAADSGFRRALVSIVDANITTLISAAIMFQFGTGPVRGFAWTLSVGC